MHSESILISSKEADLMQTYLDSDGEDSVGHIQTYTANFDNGMEVDIKICKGDPPFVDAVLYHEGEEVQLLDVTDELLGEYLFYYEGELYSVSLEEGMEIGS